ncbi:MAG TPA: SDR family oxidoreductase [Burkholderiales bacterium]|nr:SDR family oxidoreductase [Burkholderiales bacterium]
MKILITGNTGYIGPSVLRQLRQSYPKGTLIGFDKGYFAHCLTNADILPECRADIQYFADVRHVDPEILRGVDAVVHLAAISNDPMGKTFEDVTYDINFRASADLAKQAKAAGAKSFAFASSCSMYGLADDTPRKETSPLNPLTAYAKSKVRTEGELQKLADRTFKVTCLRFATACGMSDRLRLDLVVNDFVACAVASKNITILSDGTPWRPLIHVRDMARAFDWAIGRDAAAHGDFLAVNVGSDEWNYQVKDLAEAIAKVVPGVTVSINKDSPQDSRSYRVDFSLYRKVAPNHQPQVDLLTTIRELKAGLEAMGFSDANFRGSKFMRLQVLKWLREKGMLDANLEWVGR